MLKFIDIYNRTAEQAWSMFDSEVENSEEFETALTSSIQKALVDLWCLYPYPFREKNLRFKTQEHISSYEMPQGNIKQTYINGKPQYCVQLNNNGYLEYSKLEILGDKLGVPEYFYIIKNKLCLYPIPDKEYDISIDYFTLILGKDKDENPIFYLSNDDDCLDIEPCYENLFLTALIRKSMIYAIANNGDENYSGYLMQFNEAYKNLINYCTGINTSKRIAW